MKKINLLKTKLQKYHYIILFLVFVVSFSSILLTVQYHQRENIYNQLSNDVTSCTTELNRLQGEYSKNLTDVYQYINEYATETNDQVMIKVITDTLDPVKDNCIRLNIAVNALLVNYPELENYKSIGDIQDTNLDINDKINEFDSIIKDLHRAMGKYE
jgi:hypothetical protein